MGNTPKSCPVLAPWRPRQLTEKAGDLDTGAVWGRSVVEPVGGGGGGESGGLPVLPSHSCPSKALFAATTAQSHLEPE